MGRFWAALATSMTALLISLATLPAQADFVPVCERHSAVRLAIAGALNKHCEDIRPEDLTTITKLSVRISNKGQLKEIADLTGLTDLKLSGNLGRLPADFLGFLPLVEKLSLSDGKLNVEGSHIFRSLVRLKSLTFDRCDLRKLNPRLFEDLIQLEELVFDGNKGMDLNLALLEPTQNLKSFKLLFSAKDPIDLSHFPDPDRLEELHIEIADVPPTFLQSLNRFRNLRIIKLNAIFGIHLTFEDFEWRGDRLEELDLRGFGVAPTREELDQFPRLKVLRIGGSLSGRQSPMTFSQDFFAGHPSLETVDLDGAALVNTPRSAFRGIQVLNLPPTFAVEAEANGDWGL